MSTCTDEEFKLQEQVNETFHGAKAEEGACQTGIVVIDASLAIRAVSAGLARLFGRRSESALIGLHLRALCLCPTLQQGVRQVRDEGRQVAPIGIRLDRGTGGRRPIAALSPARINSEAGVLLIFSDQGCGSELPEDSDPGPGEVCDGTLVLDGEGSHIVDVGPGALDLLGYAREELIGVPLQDLEAGTAAVVNPARPGHKFPLSMTTIFRRKDGTTLPLAVRLVPWANGNGSLLAGLTDLSRCVSL